MSFLLYKSPIQLPFNHTHLPSHYFPVNDSHARRTSSKVEALKAKQGQLYNRMLSVVRSVEVLRCRGVPISSAERK